MERFGGRGFVPRVQRIGIAVRGFGEFREVELCAGKSRSVMWFG